MTSTKTLPPKRRRRWHALGAVLALVGAALLAWVLRPRERDVLADLPAQERAALFERTKANLTTVCSGSGAKDLEQFCRSEASLLVKFRECDDVCLALAKPYLPEPSR